MAVRVWPPLVELAVPAMVHVIGSRFQVVSVDTALPTVGRMQYILRQLFVLAFR